MVSGIGCKMQTCKSIPWIWESTLSTCPWYWCPDYCSLFCKSFYTFICVQMLLTSCWWCPSSSSLHMSSPSFWRPSSRAPFLGTIFPLVSSLSDDSFLRTPRAVLVQDAFPVPYQSSPPPWQHLRKFKKQIQTMTHLYLPPYSSTTCPPLQPQPLPGSKHGLLPILWVHHGLLLC